MPSTEQEFYKELIGFIVDLAETRNVSIFVDIKSKYHGNVHMHVEPPTINVAASEDDEFDYGQLRMDFD